MKFEPQYPEVLVQLAHEIRRRLLQLGLEEARAEVIAYEVAEHVRLQWGGTDDYIPRGSRYEIARRDREIYQKFNGTNQRALAEAYNLSPRRLYEIIKAAELAERQPQK